MTVFERKGLDKQYEFNKYLDGLSWEEDFNGDRVTDIAITVVNKTTKKKRSLLIIHGKTHDHFFFGPGTKMEKWVTSGNPKDAWEISFQKKADESIIDPKNGEVTGRRIIALKESTSIAITEYDEGSLQDP